MYLSDYLVFILALLACMVFSMIAGGKVKSAYSTYSRVPCRSGLSGRETAERLLRMNGVYDIALGRVSGELTDHYAPNQSIVNLSTGTADSRSVAAAAVAAHEIGHVMQNKEGYGPYRVRTALVPVVNFGSRLAMPLVLIGILLDTYVRTANPDTGFYVAMAGVVLYGGSFLFSLVTLPVELDASRRAGEMLLAAGVIAGLVAFLGALIAALHSGRRKLLCGLGAAGGYALVLLLGNLLFFGVHYGEALPVLLPLAGAGLLGALLGAGRRKKRRYA